MQSATPDILRLTAIPVLDEGLYANGVYLSNNGMARHPLLKRHSRERRRLLIPPNASGEMKVCCDWKSKVAKRRRPSRISKRVFPDVQSLVVTLLC